MSTYKNIRGKAIKSVSTNLSDSGAEGQIWFNTTDNQFKSVVTIQAWSSVAGMNRSPGTGGTGVSGTSTATVAFGGQKDNPYPVITDTEEFNGSGWSTSGAVPAARYSWVGGIGIQTAAVGAGGLTSPGPVSTDSYEYNGSSWTADGSISTGRCDAGGAGTLTAGLAMGGRTGGPGASSNSTAVEEYNGTSWTGGTVMPAATDQFTGAGLQTAAIQAGGDLTNSSSGISSCSEYDGSSWTALPSLNTSGRAIGNSGTTTSALAYGGQNRTTATESFNGTSWTTSPATLTTARSTSPNSNSNSAPNNSSALAVGTPPYAAACEQYNSSANVITQAAWSTGSSLGTARYGGGFGMTQDTAAIAGNDAGGTATGKTELYDGTSFTETGDLSQVGYRRALTGTQTAALAVGAYSAPSIRNWNEEFNGSSWTAAGTFPSISQFGSAAGPQTAAFYGGQYSSSTEDYNEWYDYDGSSWTASTPSSSDKGQQRGLLGNAAAQTAAVACGGYDPGGSAMNDTESWNGSAWTSGNNVPTSGWAWGYAGTSTAGLIFCNTPGTTTNAISWDGTNWITAPSTSTARASIQGGAGTSTSAIQMGGNLAPGYTAATEEFNPGTSTLNVKTLTQS